MNLLSGILNGLGEIRAHKLRSLLTICCVLLGVTSLVLTDGFMEGMFVTWGKSFDESGGLERVTCTPQAPPERQAPIAAVSPGLTWADAESVRAAVPNLTHVSATMEGTFDVVRGSHRMSRQDVQGVTNEALAIARHHVEEGRNFCDFDHMDAAPVVLIGSAIRKELFEPGESPLGRWIEVDGRPFRVVGVLRNEELLWGKYNTLRWKNEVVFMPLATMRARLSTETRINSLDVRVADLSRLSETVDALSNLLRERHRGLRDTRIMTSEAQLASYARTKSSFVFGGAAIAGISLLVSGIGIMNLMLASINERVREIGVRKALGATPANLFIQFVAEAVSLSLVGGLAGVATASGLIAYLATTLPPGRVPVLSLSAVLVGFGFSVAAGVLAGVYPAFRAARLDPIEALRHE